MATARKLSVRQWPGMPQEPDTLRLPETDAQGFEQPPRKIRVGDLLEDGKCLARSRQSEPLQHAKDPAAFVNRRNLLPSGSRRSAQAHVARQKCRQRRRGHQFCKQGRTMGDDLQGSQPAEVKLPEKGSLLRRQEFGIAAPAAIVQRNGSGGDDILGRLRRRPTLTGGCVLEAHLGPERGAPARAKMGPGELERGINREGSK
jgi:hypothetical protein